MEWPGEASAPGPFQGSVSTALVLADASRAEAVEAATRVSEFLKERGVTITLETDARTRCAQGPLVEAPDLVAFPRFAEAKFEETVLRPGDVLFMPRGMWHYVRGLTTSFSVNFWWN